MEVLGIGNAIVDILCKVDETFLKKHSLTKSTMKLIEEKEFRSSVKDFDWDRFNDGYVAVICSSGAIIPTWAYLLIASKLKDNCITNIVGDLDYLEKHIFSDIINSIDFSNFNDKSIVIKGCSKKNIPIDAYSQLINRLKPIAKRIMFGEACSTVPLYKK